RKFSDIIRKSRNEIGGVSGGQQKLRGSGMTISRRFYCRKNSKRHLGLHLSTAIPFPETAVKLGGVFWFDHPISALIDLGTDERAMEDAQPIHVQLAQTIVWKRETERFDVSNIIDRLLPCGILKQLLRQCRTHIRI